MRREKENCKQFYVWERSEDRLELYRKRKEKCKKAGIGKREKKAVNVGKEVVKIKER